MPETIRTAETTIYFPDKERVNFIKRLNRDDRFRLMSVGRVKGKEGSRVFTNMETSKKGYVEGLKKKGRDISQ